MMSFLLFFFYKKKLFTLNNVNSTLHYQENLWPLSVEYFSIHLYLNGLMFHDEICLEDIVHQFVVMTMICLVNVADSILFYLTKNSSYMTLLLLPLLLVLVVVLVVTIMTMMRLKIDDNSKNELSPCNVAMMMMNEKQDSDRNPMQLNSHSNSQERIVMVKQTFHKKKCFVMDTFAFEFRNLFAFYLSNQLILFSLNTNEKKIKEKKDLYVFT